MARPFKAGADYFPMDTDFFQDRKIKLVRGNFGAKMCIRDSVDGASNHLLFYNS